MNGGKRKKSAWQRIGWARVASLLTLTAVTLAAVSALGAIILQGSDETSKNVMFFLALGGSFLAGLALAIPVARAEHKRKLRKDKIAALMTGLVGFALTALSVWGLTALDMSTDNWRALLGLLGGTFLGVLSGLVVPGELGRRQGDRIDSQEVDTSVAMGVALGGAGEIGKLADT